MTDYGRVLSVEYPGRQFAVGETYESIRSLDGGPIPTKADLDGAWPAVRDAMADEQARRARQADFIAEADPLFMKWQAGEATEAEWLAKREEIRQRYPYSEASALIGG
jgi:hypothetical protein